ncbi:Transcriptional regulator [Eupransor demetentiae]|uniref:Contains XRE-family HTH domain (HipB) n=2 Tax=Eupransor demetentiae TaxID=3109584 RepID=A0ABM9N332_9LACO|nr:Transcriptional regulator [Lactobacillaceae bacterium LMG 33000]
MLRQKKNLSQEGLAQKLFVSRQSISKWENGEVEPSIDKLIMLAEIFAVDLDFLLLGKSQHDEVILKMAKVQKHFDKAVLRDVNLEVRSRDRIALLGSNGSGKTTIVNLILGAYRPNGGQIQRYFKPEDDLSVMPQENHLLEALRLKEQVALSAKIQGQYKAQNLKELVNQFHLTDQSRKLISQLSGGQKRRLALLLALLKPSKLVILDEPTVGMDLESIDFFWSYLEHVSGAVITITHDFNQIDRYFNRVLLLKDGVIAADERVATIHSNNQTIEQWYRANNQSQEQPA